MASRGISWAAILLTVLGVLLLGGAHPLINTILGIGWLILLLVTLRLPSRKPVFGAWRDPLNWALWLAFGWSILQAIPFPPSLVHLLQPDRFAVWKSLNPSPSWITLSAAPIETWHGVLRLGTLLAVYSVGRRLAAHRSSATFALGGLTLGGALVVFIGVVSRLLGWAQPWGVFGTPSEAFLPTTLVNPNHAATLFLMCVWFGIAMAHAHRGRVRVAWVLAAAVCATGLILSESRAGIAVGVLSGLLGGLFLVFRWRRDFVVASVGILFVVGGLTLSLSDDLQHKVAKWTDAPRALQKSDLWRMAPPIMAAYPTTGVGRGALGAVFPRYQALPSERGFSYIENSVLQSWIDWGVPIGTIVLLLILAGLIFRLAVVETSFAQFAMLGVTAGFLHGLTEFSFELSALSTMAVLSLTAPISTLPCQSPGRQRPVSTLIGVGILLAGIALIALGVRATYFDLGRDTRRLREMLVAKVDRDVLLARSRAILERHPEDYFLRLLLADGLVRVHGDPGSALGLANQAMLLAPHFAAPHRVAGEALFIAGRAEQGMHELALAAGVRPERTRSLAWFVWRNAEDRGAVLNLVHTSPDVAVRIARFLTERGAFAEVVQLGKRKDLATPRLTLFLAQAHYRLGQYQACINVLEAQPGLRALVWRSLSHLALNNLAAAERMLRDGLKQHGERRELLNIFAQLLVRQQRFLEALQLSNRLVSGAYGSDTRALGLSLRAQVYEEQGRSSEAMEAYRRATEEQPSLADHWLRYAGALQRANNSVELKALSAIITKKFGGHEHVLKQLDTIAQRDRN